MDVLVVGQKGSSAGMVARLISKSSGTPLLRRIFSYGDSPDEVEAKRAELTSPEFESHFRKHRRRRIEAEIAASAAPRSDAQTVEATAAKVDTDWRTWEANSFPASSHSFLYDLLRKWHIPVTLMAGYAEFREQDLSSFASSAYQEGGFCLVHVVRNPVACLVTQQTTMAPDIGLPPSSAFLIAEDVDDFVREHANTWRLVKESCEDRFVFHYPTFVRGPKQTLASLFQFLELKVKPPADPLAGRSVKPARDRLVSFAWLRTRVKPQAGAQMDDLDKYS